MIFGKKCVGNCPKCDSININYGVGNLVDETFVYNATCDDCGVEFKEEYTLKYNISYITN